MSLTFQHLTTPINKSLNAIHVKLPHFIVPWHFHPEIEIMYVLNGEGTRFVGDNVEQYTAGDVVMVGSNIPHVWRSNNHYCKRETKLYAECLVIFFTPEIFGKDFLSLPEMTLIKELLSGSQRGIKFEAEESVVLKRLIKDIFETDGPGQIIKMLQLLHQMTMQKHARYLCSLGYVSNIEYRDYDRMKSCIEYIMANFQENMDLNKIAEIANMTPNSFCRYFKKRTTKSYTTFINELRIGKACQLLTESNKKIIEIAYECGFNCLSNFNEQFKKIKKLPPRQYRKNNSNNYQLS